MKQRTVERIIILMIMVYFLGTIVACGQHNPQTLNEPHEQVYLIQPEICGTGYCENTIKRYSLCGFVFYSGQEVASTNVEGDYQTIPIQNGFYILGGCKFEVRNVNVFTRIR